MDTEYPLLHLARAVVIVEVEPGLADANDPRMRRERREVLDARLRVIGGFMRMHPDRAPDVLIRFGDRAHRRKFVEPGANRHHRADPRGAGAFDDRLALFREIGEIEMAMAVDQHRRPAQALAASASTKRGKIPCGAGSARPGGKGSA